MAGVRGVSQLHPKRKRSVVRPLLRVLFLPNWAIQRDWSVWSEADGNAHAHWFFRHFAQPVSTRVIGTDVWRGSTMEDRLLHFYTAQALRAIALLDDVDVIVCHGAQSAVLLLALSRLRNVPPIVVIDVGTLNGGRPGRRLSYRATRWAFGEASSIVWHSRGSLELVKATAPELLSKGFFVGYGVDGHRFSDYLNVEKEDYVLCVGSRYRDWATLLQAWDGIEDIRLVLVGAASKVRSRNSLVEVMPDVDMATYCRMTAAARFTILPISESAVSCGQMTLLQSLAMGTPVIASDAAPIRDYLGFGTIAVPPNDPGALREAAKTLWCDSSSQALLRNEGLRAVHVNFSQKRMAQDLEELLMRVVDT
jgi:glycosyltransferase involved in cell wall biosynthesis